MTPEEQRKKEAEAAAKAKYEAAQKAGEDYAEKMRLAAGKVKAKGITGSALMKNRQAGKPAAILSKEARAEKNEEASKKEGESILGATAGATNSNWFYLGAGIVIFSLIGSGVVNLLNARPVVPQGGPR